MSNSLIEEIRLNEDRSAVIDLSQLLQPHPLTDNQTVFHVETSEAYYKSLGRLIDSDKCIAQFTLYLAPLGRHAFILKANIMCFPRM